MKKALLLLVSLSFIFTLQGCSFLISLGPSSNLGSGEDFWKNRYTGKKLDSYLYSQCLAKSERYYLMKNNFALTDSFDEYQLYLNAGKCLRDQGYVFTANPFSTYCYHDITEAECRGFRESGYK